MLEYKVNFDRICDIITKWKWNELYIGLEKSLISYTEIISYATLILSEDIDYFESVLELSIAEEDEVQKILLNLVLGEGEQDKKTINLKWIFAIINDTYIYQQSKLYDVIEDVYVEFEYPKEISNLISYMPCDDSRSLDVRINDYIQSGRKIWCDS